MPQYTSAASPIPHGNAFLVTSPETDFARQQLMQQQQQRELYAQRESMQLDKEMAKEFGAIRNTDSPEVIANYGKYKDAMKKVYFDPKVRNDPYELAKAKQEADLNLSNVYAGIEGSKEKKQMAQDLLRVHSQHPERFQNNFGDLYTAMMNTPSSKLKEVNVGGKVYDLSNPDTFFDYRPSADLGSMMAKAVGKPMERFHVDTPIGTEGIQTRRTPILFGASDRQYVESLIGQLHSGQAEKVATGLYRSLSPDTIAQIEQQYNAISPEKRERMTGSKNHNPLTLDEAQSDAERYAILQGMKYAINNDPSEGKPQIITNEERKMQQQQMNRLQLQQNAFKHSNWMANYNQGRVDQRQQRARDWSTLDDEEKTASIENGFKQQFDEAFSSQDKPVVIPTDVGSTLSGYTVEPIAAVTKALSFRNEKGHFEEPEMKLMSSDGQNYIGVFTKTDKKGNVTVDDEKTKVIPVKELVQPVRKELLGAAKTGKGLGTAKNEVPKPSAPVSNKPKPKVVKQNGVTYTLNEKTGEYE